MPTVELRGLSALEAWSKRITSGYCNVHVQDLSSSWRDGLAFCAIIHYFRPDLIEFDSLSKENVLFNNQLAFSVGKSLGIPALLDPKDMVELTELDRSSIALYLSEIYHCFEGASKRRLSRNKSLSLDTASAAASSSTSSSFFSRSSPSTPIIRSPDAHDARLGPAS